MLEDYEIKSQNNDELPKVISTPRYEDNENVHGEETQLEMFITPEQRAFKAIQDGAGEWLNVLIQTDTERQIIAQIEDEARTVSRMELAQMTLEFKANVYVQWADYYKTVDSKTKTNPLGHGYTSDIINKRCMVLLDEYIQQAFKGWEGVFDKTKEGYMPDGELVSLEKGTEGRRRYKIMLKECYDRLKTESKNYLEQIRAIYGYSFEEIAKNLTAQKEVCETKYNALFEEKSLHAAKRETLKHNRAVDLQRKYDLCKSLLLEEGVHKPEKDIPDEVWIEDLQGEPETPFQRIAKQLAQSNLSPDLKNFEGETLLHKAVLTNDVGLVELLMECGANPFIKNQNDISPIRSALNGGNRNILCPMLLFLCKKSRKPINLDKPFYEFPPLPDENELESTKGKAVRELWRIFSVTKQILDNGIDLYVGRRQSWTYHFEKTLVVDRLKNITDLLEELYFDCLNLSFESFRQRYLDLRTTIYQINYSEFHTTFRNFLNALTYDAKRLTEYIKEKARQEDKDQNQLVLESKNKELTLENNQLKKELHKKDIIISEQHNTIEEITAKYQTTNQDLNRIKEKKKTIKKELVIEQSRNFELTEDKKGLEQVIVTYGTELQQHKQTMEKQNQTIQEMYSMILELQQNNKINRRSRRYDSEDSRDETPNRNNNNDNETDNSSSGKVFPQTFSKN